MISRIILILILRLDSDISSKQNNIFEEALNHKHVLRAFLLECLSLPLPKIYRT